jgi:hypothetical protein
MNYRKSHAISFNYIKVLPEPLNETHYFVTVVNGIPILQIRSTKFYPRYFVNGVRFKTLKSARASLGA